MPWNFGWLHASSSAVLQMISSHYYLLLIWSSQHNAINIMHQYDILWKRKMIKIPLNKVMTGLESYYVLKVKLERYVTGRTN